MSELTDNTRFYLQSDKFGKELIEEIKDFKETEGGDYSLEDEGHFTSGKKSSVTLYQQGYDYIMSLLLDQGPRARVRLIKEVKDYLSLEETWFVESDPHINMYTLIFHEQDDNKQVECELVEGGDLKRMNKGFKDEFDITAADLPELPYVNLRLDPRAIIKRSRFISSFIEVNAKDDQGATARAVPLELDYTSEQQYIGEISNYLANSVNDTYAKLTTSGNLIIQNVPRDLEYTINGTVAIEITGIAFSGYLHMDLVRYENGTERDFAEIIERLDSGDPTNFGEVLTYTFVDYNVILKEGESLGIMTLSDTASIISQPTLKYKTTEDTDIILKTDTPFPTTHTKALKPIDAFERIAGLIMGDQDYPTVSDIFGPGGRHENKLLVHGTWLRNMPQIINEGEEDERRIQANLKAEDLYGAYSLPEPLRYDVKLHKNRRTFVIGSFRFIQQNFTAIRIGETTDKFRLVELKGKDRYVIGENYYRIIKLGSNTSGSNYGQVNNLYSMCGNVEWRTINDESEGEYEILTDFRIGAEDIELQRQFQWKDNPDIDGEYDDDWFLVDAKFNGVEYEVKTWDDYYEQKPTGVHSPETNYNWAFHPIELLRGHGYKINAGLRENPTEKLYNPTGNCTLSLKTKRAGEPEITSNEPFPHNLLEEARIRLMMVEGNFPMNQEIIKQLQGKTNGVDNKFGLVEVSYEGVSLKGRLFDISGGSKAEIKLIQAEL